MSWQARDTVSFEECSQVERKRKEDAQRSKKGQQEKKWPLDSRDLVPKGRTSGQRQ